VIRQEENRKSTVMLRTSKPMSAEGGKGNQWLLAAFGAIGAVFWLLRLLGLGGRAGVDV